VGDQHRSGEPFQIYIVHKENDPTRTASDHWWKHQSNVHGVVMSVYDIPKDTICMYPRTLEKVVAHFIPGIVIAESDFEAAAHCRIGCGEHRDAVQYLGNDKRIFLQALALAIRKLFENFRSAKSRQEARYAGWSWNVVAAALAECDEAPGHSVTNEAEASRLGVSCSPRGIKRRRQWLTE